MVATEQSEIVAGGRSRLRSTPEFEASREQIEREAAEHFDPLIAQAGFLGRLRLKRQRRVWISKRIEALAPQDALYLRRG